MPRLLRAALVGAPPLVAALLGLLHPLFLTPDTAGRWRLVHVLLLPFFPLIGGSVLYLLRRVPGALAWVARIGAFAFSFLYGALDSIAGIGAPAQVQHRGRAAPIGDLFVAGDQLGHLGVLALAGSLLLTAGLLWRRSGAPWALIGGALSAVSTYWFYKHHVFPPRGVLAMLGLAVGYALLAWSEQVSAPAPSRRPS